MRENETWEPRLRAARWLVAGSHASPGAELVEPCLPKGWEPNNGRGAPRGVRRICFVPRGVRLRCACIGRRLRPGRT